ncbi:MAG: transketolase family protein [Spirochaetaceae bacterium]|jgi:transketolase|nr:transketolase family protein [Spirochaetaceae bacterium]
MAFTVVYDGSYDELQHKNYYAAALKDLLEKNPQVVVGEADIGLGLFGPDYYELRKKYGDRFFDVGIQEANLAGVAAGLSVTGKIPYIHSFSPFMSRRVYDTVFISLAYAKLNARLYGSDPGIVAAYNGGTHMSFEDVGIMRGIPGITIIDISDGVMLDFVLRDSAEKYGLFYIRGGRGFTSVKIYGSGSTFTYGKANLLREGSDVTIIASGIMVEKALHAAEQLKAGGISARVVDIFTIKPLDEDYILKCAEETKAIVVAENHRTATGLSAAVAGVIAREGIGIPFATVGVGDEFGQVGCEKDLAAYYKLTMEEIAAKAQFVAGKKKTQ